jgi:hypothetical protein
MHSPRRSFRYWTAVKIALSATIVGTGLLAVAGPAAAAATVNAPSSGVAGRNIVVSGTGWPSFDNVSAYLIQGATKTFFCSLTADASGNLGPGTCPFAEHSGSGRVHPVGD